MHKIKLLLIAFITLAFWQNANAQVAKQIHLADPTIFYHNKTYYLYGTGGIGFKVYTSNDKKSWKYSGIALKKGDAFGTAGFWAPQVFAYQDKFYMAYVANENIAIAESDSPLGPFKQKVKQSIKAPVRMIDPFVFFDGGKIYLYHVRLSEGNRVYVAEMNKDLMSIKEETAKECISASEPWENTQNAAWPVTEGPTVLKHQNLYYLFYSANDFRNPDYAVGYAISDNPYGPWKKYSGSPILSKVQTGVNGTGHGDFFVDRKGKLNYVFHTHESNDNPKGSRQTALVTAQFVKKTNEADVMEVNPQTIEFLKEQ